MFNKHTHGTNELSLHSCILIGLAELYEYSLKMAGFDFYHYMCLARSSNNSMSIAWSFFCELSQVPLSLTVTDKLEQNEDKNFNYRGKNSMIR